MSRGEVDERSSRFARWPGDCRATWTAAPSAGPAFRGTSVQFLPLPAFGRIDVRVRDSPCAGYILLLPSPTGPRTLSSSPHPSHPLLASAHPFPSLSEYQP